jgi:hypothetical protein
MCPQILVTYNLAECPPKAPHIIALEALSFQAFQMFVELIIAERLGLPPMCWSARLRQVPRIVIQSSFRRGVRE